MLPHGCSYLDQKHESAITNTPFILPSGPVQSPDGCTNSTSFSHTGLPCSIFSTITCARRHDLTELPEASLVCPTTEAFCIHSHTPHTSQSELLELVVPFLCWKPSNTNHILTSITRLCHPHGLLLQVFPRSTLLSTRTVATLVFGLGNTLHSPSPRAICTCQARRLKWSCPLSLSFPVYRITRRSITGSRLVWEPGKAPLWDFQRKSISLHCRGFIPSFT